jgi:hypothetical protein
VLPQDEATLDDVDFFWAFARVAVLGEGLAAPATELFSFGQLVRRLFEGQLFLLAHARRAALVFSLKRRLLAGHGPSHGSRQPIAGSFRRAVGEGPRVGWGQMVRMGVASGVWARSKGGVQCPSG